MTVRVSYPALAQSVRRHPSLRQRLQPVAAAATREARALAGQRTERRTGRLEAGYRSEVLVGGVGPVVARVRTTNAVPHAVIIESGSRPHPIHPKPPVNYLRFYWKKKGRWVTIVPPRFVKHPGTRPYNIIRDALQRIAARKHT